MQHNHSGHDSTPTAATNPLNVNSNAERLIDTGCAALFIVILLFGRRSKDDDAFWFLGPASYVSHSGEYPVAFTWRLEHELPAALVELFAAAA